MSIIERLEPGFYAKGQDGGFYKVELPIRMRPSKTINLKTGEVKYATNADRIRSMTNEELAEVFSELVDCACCPCNCSDGTCGNCERQWILWLKQECES